MQSSQKHVNVILINRNNKITISRHALIFKMVSLAVYLAYFIVSGFSVFLAYIPFGPFWLTYLPLIVAMATFQFGYSGAMVAGFGFGISSFIASMLLGLFWFQNLDVSVVSRLLVGVVSCFAYRVLNIKKSPKLWKFVLLTLVATEFNSIFVFGSLYIHSKFIGELSGLPPLRDMLILNTINLIAEPILNVSMSVLLFMPVLGLKQRYEARKNVSW